jgi:hypothetical protein
MQRFRSGKMRLLVYGRALNHARLSPNHSAAIGYGVPDPWASTVLDSDMERAEAHVHPRILNTGLTVLDQVRKIGIS